MGLWNPSGILLTIQIASGNEHYRQHFIEVLVDAAYDDVQIRQYLRSRAIKSNIPINKSNSKRKKEEILDLMRNISLQRDYRTILCMVKDGI